MEYVVRYRGGYKVLDLVDGYTAVDSNISDVARGFAKNFMGQTTGKPRRYSESVQRACKSVDMVICSSEEQAELVSIYNPNVSVILDSHHEFLQPSINISSTHPNRSSIFWEGQTATLRSLDQISRPLREAYTQHHFRLNLVTDKRHKLLMNRGLSIKSEIQIPKLKKIFVKELMIYPWSREIVIEIANKSTLGIIPVNMRSGIQKLKPENRILIMWQLGLPCLASNTPSHSRLANQTKLDFICRTPQEWSQKISEYLLDPQIRANQVIEGKKYLSKFHNEKIILKKWDKIFGMVN